MSDPTSQRRYAEFVGSLYERHAGVFNQRRREGAFIEARWLARFVNLIKPSGLVLDLGCGAGYPNAHYLTERGLKIDGVDIAPAMIEQCRSQWPGQTWRVGDMRTAPLFGPYDAALAWHSSFHLPATDQAELINRVAGALKPAAPFLFTGGPSEGVVWGEMEGEPLFHASLAPDRYDQSLEAAGLQVVARRVEDPDCGGASVWLARKR